MPTLHHVKKARKANKEKGIKIGDEYWWAGYRMGASSYKRYWKSKPRPSQVASSEYVSNVLFVREEIEDWQFDGNADDEDACSDAFDEAKQEWVSRIEEIRDGTREKLDNMPDSLQQGDTGQLLQERIDALDQWINEIESAETSDEAAETCPE